jgi:ATP-dependent helicase/nuclease subunit B
MGAELRSVAQGQTPALARLSRQKWLESRANAGVPCLRAPAPVISSAQLPTRITASQYQSLVDCPYQYFARAVLGLREGDDVREEMEKRDLGEYVHAILKRFHRRFPVVGAVPREALRAAIEDDTSAEFAQAIEQNFTAHAWRLSWTTAIDTYLDWQISREASGWRWSEGESTRALPIVFDDGGQLQLEGRLDRLDQRESGEKGVELAVIDYKTVAVQTLRDKLKRPGEDVQLPVYAALAGVSGAPVGEASYLAIARDAVDPVECPEPADAAGEAVVRLVDMFKALRAGAPLRAQGTDPVCEHCEMRGLCRRDHWSES